MNRLRKMTPTAQQATWCKLSTGANHIPTQWLIKGDKQDGYTIAAVDDNLAGFDLICLRSFYATKEFIEQVNNTGTTDFKTYCSVGSFAWANIPMPLQLSGITKDIEVNKETIHILN